MTHKIPAHKPRIFLWFFLPVIMFCIVVTNSDVNAMEEAAPVLGVAEEGAPPSPGAVGGYEGPVGMEFPPYDAEIPPVTEAPPCEFGEWIGKKADSRLEQAMKALNRPYRILPPNSMMTQDFSPGRVNFETDAKGVVTNAWCG